LSDLKTRLEEDSGTGPNHGAALSEKA